MLAFRRYGRSGCIISVSFTISKRGKRPYIRDIISAHGSQLVSPFCDSDGTVSRITSRGDERLWCPNFADEVIRFMESRGCHIVGTTNTRFNDVKVEKVGMTALGFRDQVAERWNGVLHTHICRSAMVNKRTRHPVITNLAMDSTGLGGTQLYPLPQLSSLRLLFREGT
jgi:hypothetical protein